MPLGKFTQRIATLPPLGKAKRLRRPKPKKVRDSGKSDGEIRPAELPMLEHDAAELPPLPPSLTDGLDTNREPLFIQAGTKKPIEDFADLNAADVIAIAIKVQAHWRGQVARSRWREATRQIRECCWCLQCEHDVEVSGSQPSHPVKSLIARLETRLVVIHFPSSDRRSYYVVIYANDSTLVEFAEKIGIKMFLRPQKYYDEHGNRVVPNVGQPKFFGGIRAYKFSMQDEFIPAYQFNQFMEDPFDAKLGVANPEKMAGMGRFNSGERQRCCLFDQALAA
jgi:hypothetical protein